MKKINRQTRLDHVGKESIARVAAKNGQLYELLTAEGQVLKAEVTSDQSYVVGDRVVYRVKDGSAQLLAFLPRQNKVTKARTTTKTDFRLQAEEQVLAANVDQLFILIAADQRFTLSKFERYCMVFAGLVDHLEILISKSDYHLETQSILDQVHAVYPQLRVTPYSIFDEESLEVVVQLFDRGKTALVLGASGVGKSTLLNYLLAEETCVTQDVRRDGKGRHTTTTTRLYYLTNNQSYVIDSPGFRGIETTRAYDPAILFEEIEMLAGKCKFSDCQHQTEPGCAIKKAIQEGRIDSQLLDRYIMQKNKRQAYKDYLARKEKRKAGKLR